MSTMYTIPAPHQSPREVFGLPLHTPADAPADPVERMRQHAREQGWDLVTQCGAWLVEEDEFETWQWVRALFDAGHSFETVAERLHLLNQELRSENRAGIDTDFDYDPDDDCCPHCGQPY